MSTSPAASFPDSSDSPVHGMPAFSKRSEHSSPAPARKSHTTAADRRLIVYADKRVLAQAAAQRTVLTILDILDARPAPQRVDVGLTGGSDAIAALALMAENPLIDAIDWSRVHVWWGDERFVAPDSADRNAVQARTGLLDSLVRRGLLPQSNIHEMPADIRSAQDVSEAGERQNAKLLDGAARHYEEEIVRELGSDPRMDLLILGMGPDGHYASLFPHFPQIGITDRMAVGVTGSPKPPSLRISLTAPLLARSARTWFLTAGAGKADALAHVFAHPNDPAYPASFAAGMRELLWMTTPDAAANLLTEGGVAVNGR
ncbi:MAG: 6-phosphogluconolactonase [Bifidobacterium sp.]|nr:6-phosphogluconolactonase [Bifidobacterium sp.]